MGQACALVKGENARSPILGQLARVLQHGQRTDCSIDFVDCMIMREA